MKKFDLGIGTLTSLVVASMIGAGVFTTSGFALADVGTPQRVLAAWLIGGVVAVCGALSYGALAQRITLSGGEYVFLSRAIHPMAGFLAGWVSLLAGFTGALAFAATAFEVYVMPDSIRPALLPSDSVAIVLVAACGLAHGLQKQSGAVSHNIVVILKLVLLRRPCQVIRLYLASLLSVPSALPSWPLFAVPWSRCSVWPPLPSGWRCM